MSCNNTQCKLCNLRKATQVIGDKNSIDREFDRIEKRQQASAQTKTPSARTDGV